MSLSFRLDGKVAMVTGASRGLGAGIADALKEAGATVVGTSRKQDSAEQVAKRLDSVPVAMDVSDVPSVRAGIDRVASELGRLDILVNNAGLNIPQGVFDVDEASWDAVLDTNLKGTFFATQAAGRHMADHGGGGRIVNVASRGAFRGEPDQPAYGASKAGLNALGQSLAVALAPRGITINAVAPGFVETDMASQYLKPPRGEEIKAQSPFGRVARPEEVAAAVVWLASPEAEWASGAILDLNGASYLRT